MTSPLAPRTYLQSVLANQDMYAVISGNSPLVSISAEVGGDSGSIAVPALVGPTGPAGNAQFPLRLQLEIFSDAGQLPTDLTNTDADIGRYWIIFTTDDDGNVLSSAAYIWYGNEFRWMPFGTEGPPGIYPVIAPKVVLTPNSDELSSVQAVTGTGATTSPYHWTLNLDVPAGPAGQSCPLADFTDVNMSVPPTLGQFLAFNGSVWEPTDVGDILPQPYIVPEGAFSSYAGIDFASTLTIGAFAVPPQPFSWKPLVWGQIKAFELELSANPLQIGVEVLLGSPTPGVGTLIGRGYGNSVSGVVTISPHTSAPGADAGFAMTPSNGLNTVPANHTGAQGTIFINLINDGIVALYDFNASNSQLFALAVPTSGAPAVSLHGALGAKVTLSARSVTHGS